MPPRRRPSTSRRSFARTEAPIVRGASTPRRARSWGATGQGKQPRSACGRSSIGSGGNDEAARRAKDQWRADYGRPIRAAVRRVQTCEGVTNPQRSALGITVHDTEPPSDPDEMTFLLLGTHILARRNRGRVHRPRRWLDRALHVTMTQHPRRGRPLERGGRRDDWSIGRRNIE